MPLEHAEGLEGSAEEGSVEGGGGAEEARPARGARRACLLDGSADGASSVDRVVTQEGEDGLGLGLGLGLVPRP